ncbi:MAG: extracellular solute-binding protein [Proteobacteria bacterium]|nr:extracellular solute-binding protein [Pseudomonadota bacterium]
MKITRRSALALAGSAVGAAAATRAAAQDGKEVTLTILSHKVHEIVARGLAPGTTGGDIAGEWAKRNNVKLVWITADIDPMHDRLLRELTLRSTAIDLAFVINKYATPRMSRLLEPLAPWNQKEPIEDFKGIPPNLIASTTYNNSLFAIPFRHATTGLHYNQAIFKERGLSAPPGTPDEVIDYARKLTFTRADGTKVNGLTVPAGAGPFAVLSMLNMFGAELMDQKLNVKVNSPEMIKALRTVHELYKEGVLPSNYATLSIDEVITSVQTGQAAMVFDPFARYTIYNDPKKSKYAGQIKVIPIPADPASGRKIVAMTEIWSMVIPKNSTHKELAWSLIRDLSSPANTIRAALNGNGPIRPAAYNDPRLKEKLPYTQQEQIAISQATTIPSSYDASGQVNMIFMEESQAAVLGLKTPEEAVASMQKRIVPLVKR